MHKGCRESEKHRGKFYTISIICREAGRGSRREGRERLEYRYVLARLCRKCLKRCEVHARGKNLVGKNASRVRLGKVAVPRAQNLLPGGDIADRNLRALNGGEPAGNRSL